MRRLIPPTLVSPTLALPLALCAASIGVLALVLSMAPDRVQAQTAVWLGVNRTFDAQAATGQTSAFDTKVAARHTSHLVVTGSPVSCTYRLQGSNDGTNWFDISASDITCTSTAVSHTVDKAARYIRGNLLTLSGGTAPTVRLHYAGQ